MPPIRFVTDGFVLGSVAAQWVEVAVTVQVQDLVDDPGHGRRRGGYAGGDADAASGVQERGQDGAWLTVRADAAGS